jgi:hypothetical protein
VTAIQDGIRCSNTRSRRSLSIAHNTNKRRDGCLRVILRQELYFWNSFWPPVEVSGLSRLEAGATLSASWHCLLLA